MAPKGRSDPPMFALSFSEDEGDATSVEEIQTTTPTTSQTKHITTGGSIFPFRRGDSTAFASNENSNQRPFMTKVLAFCVLASVGTSLISTFSIQEHMSTVFDSISTSNLRMARSSLEDDVSVAEAATLYAWDESQCRSQDFVPNNKYRVLVTGGAGFVGMHTSIQLTSMGHKVIAFDNLNDYYSPALKKRRLELLAENNIEFIKGDVCDDVLVKSILMDQKIDRVIHLAAQAGVRYSLDHPMEYTKNNIDCFVKLLEVINETESPDGSGKIPLVYASSSSVYGKNTKIPFSETDSVIEQASLYGATKKSNELIAHVYHSLYGIPSMGLRFFTVYGTHGRPDMAYFMFTDQILKGQPINMFNHGEMQRDFTYIDDIVNGVIRCLDLPFRDTSNKADVVNLGNHRPEVLRHLIEVVEHNVGKKAIIISKPMQAGDVVSTYADVRKANCLLGYEPTTPLEVGIPKFVEWFMSEHGEQYADSAQPKKEKKRKSANEQAIRRLVEFF